MSGIYDPTKQPVDHVGFGTVNDESGKRFKTRSGEVVRLVQLLDEAKVRMKARLVERIEAGLTSLPMDQIDAAAENIGYGAVKYFDLRQSPTSNYIFSFDRMLYTNAALVAEQLKDGDVLKPKHPTEQALAIELLQLHDAIGAAIPVRIRAGVVVYWKASALLSRLKVTLIRAGNKIINGFQNFR
ncbi:hypothetical protein PsorP6_001327 [Peronosclerospora sorghi]|uniref:Uncharacterized protein n=1 Tax=Peronosclerospora sorghi TaxID=230839 RepID=A0ACC0WTS4_9STRA|nr:hypothetical protein PsorP6_001327 [Peronosclerospora sorghi]